jgi:hypothetical protein
MVDFYEHKEQLKTFYFGSTLTSKNILYGVTSRFIFSTNQSLGINTEYKPRAVV